MIRDKLTPKNLSRRHCGRCQSEVSRFKKQKLTIKRYYLHLATHQNTENIVTMLDPLKWPAIKT